MKTYTLEFTCLNCEKINVFESTNNRNKKFCDSNCFQEYYKNDNNFQLIQTTCIGCNKYFTYRKKNTIKKTYCSEECRSLERIKFKDNKLIEKNCEHCNKLFSFPERQKNHRKFCSKLCCYNSHLKTKPTITKEVIIKPIKKQTSFYDFYYYDQEEFGGNRIWALIRDDFTCKKCGTKYGLTVHHLDGKGFALPREKRNNHIDNLQTLCDECHEDIENQNLKIETYIQKTKIKNNIKRRR